jgi:hypothetical protein
MSTSADPATKDQSSNSSVGTILLSFSSSPPPWVVRLGLPLQRKPSPRQTKGNVLISIPVSLFYRLEALLLPPSRLREPFFLGVLPEVLRSPFRINLFEDSSGVAGDGDKGGDGLEVTRVSGGKGKKGK